MGGGVLVLLLSFGSDLGREGPTTDVRVSKNCSIVRGDAGALRGGVRWSEAGHLTPWVQEVADGRSLIQRHQKKTSPSPRDLGQEHRTTTPPVLLDLFSGMETTNFFFLCVFCYKNGVSTLCAVTQETG